MAKKTTYDRYLNSSAWQSKRKEAIQRDGGCCRLCGSSRKLTVHHRKYGRDDGQEPIDDLTTLCAACHDLFHQNRNIVSKPCNGKPQETREIISRSSPVKIFTKREIEAFEKYMR